MVRSQDVCGARLLQANKKNSRDQELRFTVHDSSDYYQLKISIFTDDKKTDLVGESWVDLKGIIISGGGQRDLWQTLTCRGKYAGEIRMEITFYDSRAKPEKPITKVQQPFPTDMEAAPTKQRPAKRRPLPSDPITGLAPTPPASAPPAINPVSDHHQTPPRLHGKRAPNQASRHAEEYNTPPPQVAPRHHSADPYQPSTQPSYPGQYSSNPSPDPRNQTQGPRDPYEASPRRYDERDYSSRAPVAQYEQPDPRRQQQQPPQDYEHYESYDVAPRQEMRQPIAVPARPPQPPAHRSSHGAMEVSPRSSFEVSPQKPSPMRQDVLRNEAHRSSGPVVYPGRPQYRTYDSAPSAMYQEEQEPEIIQYGQPSQSRQYQYDTGHSHAHPRSMQPTVEDVPETPIGYSSDSYANNSRNSPYHDERSRYERDPRSGTTAASPFQWRIPSLRRANRVTQSIIPAPVL